MPKSVFAYIWRHSRLQQIILTLITLASFPFLYYSLDLPEQIVNEAIGGAGSPYDIMGIDLNQIEYLFALSGIFLALVFINGGFKYFINVYQGVMAERMLRRMRYELFDRVLRFPLPHFRKTSLTAGISAFPQNRSACGPTAGLPADAAVAAAHTAR